MPFYLKTASNLLPSDQMCWKIEESITSHGTLRIKLECCTPRKTFFSLAASKVVLSLRLIFFSSSILIYDRPTLKTINPTSRTQLKTLLQREQLLEAERRKEAERKLLQQEQKQKSETNKVPLQVDVPPQVLQVKLTHLNLKRTVKILKI